MAIRVQENPEDFGRCGCGRRDYCDGSHGLTEGQWQARLAKALETARNQADITEQPSLSEAPGTP